MFGETIQNISRFHIDVDLRRENFNFDGVVYDKWGSMEMATGVRQVWVRVCYAHRYGHMCVCRR